MDFIRITVKTCYGNILQFGLVKTINDIKYKNETLFNEIYI